MKITIAGTGYVGLSNAILPAQHNQVASIDIVLNKVAMLNRKQSPIVDTEIEDYLAPKPLNFRAKLDKVDSYTGADFVIIATPPITTPRPTSSTPALSNPSFEMRWSSNLPCSWVTPPKSVHYSSATACCT